MVEIKQILANLTAEEVPGEGPRRRRILYCGDNLLVAVQRLEPGTRWAMPRHPEEEAVYVVRGRLEYDDGRILTAGMLTVNRSNQEHPGVVAGTEPAVLLEIYAPPVPALRPASS